MNSFYIFIVRLILGVVLGIVITRIFRPEWNMISGAGVGMGLVAAAYLMQMIRKRNANPK
ncbi:MAG: hypothetical protein V1793_25240 [Pseudomonadota bacterium]